MKDVAICLQVALHCYFLRDDGCRYVESGYVYFGRMAVN